MSHSGYDWMGILELAQSVDFLRSWQIGIATTMATYAIGGWKKIPSAKQAAQAVKIVADAEKNGVACKRLGLVARMPGLRTWRSREGDMDQTSARYPQIPRPGAIEDTQAPEETRAPAAPESPSHETASTVPPTPMTPTPPARPASAVPRRR